MRRPSPTAAQGKLTVRSWLVARLRSKSSINVVERWREGAALAGASPRVLQAARGNGGGFHLERTGNVSANVILDKVCLEGAGADLPDADVLRLYLLIIEKFVADSENLDGREEGPPHCQNKQQGAVEVIVPVRILNEVIH